MDIYTTIYHAFKDMRLINVDTLPSEPVEGQYVWNFSHNASSEFDLEKVKSILVSNGLKINEIVQGNGATIITTLE
ncbi:hypothetical protein [Spirosoma sp.]|uniref:hypothetical protein n=1 Tax=Spirosoma sp. TaxID=1899569 RepID=UPI002609EF85|nr:hypothetical protein [Spirosoma sp.]MCX6213520.1 hypothetical protein [Spirosoma sp.]